MSKFPFHVVLPTANIFIETGTAQGISSKRALKHYKEVYTMDIASQVNLGNVINEKYFFFNEDSRQVLPRILSNIQERCTFWLDAHPNNHDVGTWPLLEEIMIICRHPIKNHNILIDDFDTVINNGKVMFIIETLAKNNPLYRENMTVMTQIRALDTFIATTEKITL